MMEKYRLRHLGLEMIAILIAVVFLVPFYFVMVNSLKTFADVLTQTAAWPREFQWANYIKAWNIMHYPKAFFNSLFITTISNAGIVVLAAMAAYRMVRHPSRFNRIVFTLFVAAMVIPFQSIMIPLVKVASQLGLMQSRYGLIICYMGFGISLATFLFHGFIKTIPREIEESAVVDGCSPFKVFWRIVFPLLKPMVVTLLILNTLWIWNDFLLPLLILGNHPDLRTIPLSTYSLFGQYTKQWDLAMAALVMGITPILLFFLVMQRHIVEGIMSGSVKS